jgi:hypothetical protein
MFMLLLWRRAADAAGVVAAPATSTEAARSKMAAVATTRTVGGFMIHSPLTTWRP